MNAGLLDPAPLRRRCQSSSGYKKAIVWDAHPNSGWGWAPLVSSHFPIRSKLPLSITPPSLLRLRPRGPTDSVCNNRCQIRPSERGRAVSPAANLGVRSQKISLLLMIVSYLRLFETCFVFFLLFFLLFISAAVC